MREPHSTPAISWAIEHYGLDGGIILTASHNPANYNGLKFNGPDGAPANIATTEQLTAKANHYLNTPPTYFKTKPGTVKTLSIQLEFAEQLVQKVTRAFGDDPTGLGDAKIIVDARHGATGEIWRELKKILGLMYCNVMHETPLDDFAGIEPNPYHPDTLAGLKEELSKGEFTLACAHDPDGDRHLIMDENGTLLTPEEIMIVILDQLIEAQCPIGALTTTLASSNIIESAAKHHDFNYYETKVGFKYFSTYLKQGRKVSKYTLAVESSGGFSTSFHTLEKCGYLPVVMILYSIAISGKPLSKLVNDVHEKYGKYYFKEVAISFPTHLKIKLSNSIKNSR